MKHKRIAGGILGFGIFLTSVGMLSVAAAVEYETLNTCRLLAWTPGHSFTSGNAWAQGGRDGCVDAATVTVNLWEDKPYALDRHLVSGSQNGKTVKFTVYTTITSGDRGKKFYTETVSSTGATRQSDRALFY